MRELLVVVDLVVSSSLKASVEPHLFCLKALMELVLSVLAPLVYSQIGVHQMCVSLMSIRRFRQFVSRELTELVQVFT